MNRFSQLCCVCCSVMSYTPYSLFSNSDSVTCDMFNCSKKDLIKSGFYRMKRVQGVICCGCGWESGDYKLTIRHLNFIHKLINPDCEMSCNIGEDFHKYYDHKSSVVEIENMMRETFLFWPKMYPCIDDMVKCGLYYIGFEDEVSCIDCKIVLKNWKLDESPLVKHEKASPFCKIVKLLNE